MAKDGRPHRKGYRSPQAFRECTPGKYASDLPEASRALRQGKHALRGHQGRKELKKPRSRIWSGKGEHSESKAADRQAQQEDVKTRKKGMSTSPNKRT